MDDNEKIVQIVSMLGVVPGAEHEMTVAVSRQGYPMSFGWNTSTLREMARFGMIFTPS